MKTTVACLPLPITDHYPILTECSIPTGNNNPPVKRIFRRLNSICMDKFAADLATSPIVTHPPSSLTDLVDSYNDSLQAILNKHAPLVEKLVSSRPSNNWFTPLLFKLKRERRHLEHVWRKTTFTSDLARLKAKSNLYHFTMVKIRFGFKTCKI